MRIFFLLLLFFYQSICYSQLNIPCNNWLNLPSYRSYVSVGDLDVPGNKITVEAIFCRTAPYSNGYNWAGDLVSKHVDPTDVNYLLRPNNTEITTTNGFFTTPPICEIELNKVYHAAMVYDGSMLKFYRNGFLMSSVAATGNMFQNNHQTRIGLYDALIHNTNLIGYINEVRIWNVARTQGEIRTYMNNQLPSPPSQTGLIAYYTFDNLLNKQGNSTWNGTLGGSASINQTLSNCSYFPDSCHSRVNIGNVINDYTPVIAFNPCENKITVENANEYNAGDTVLLIQMKGGIIDSTNTAAFGTVTNYKNAGNYEFNYVKSKVGNIIELKNKVIRQYDVPSGKVQLIRVPYYENVTVSSTLTCLPWDGNKGGVLVLNVQDTINLDANIDVSGMGLKGGSDPFSNPPSFNCYENQFFYPVNPDLASEKGESISIISTSKSYGKGANANGGGSGNSHNSGGGGGSNFGNGGFGGYNFEADVCSVIIPFNNRGLGGKSLTYNNTVNKVFLGGGGGAGHSNNPQAFESKGGNGAGIVIIISDKIKANGNKILANGNNGYPCNSTGSGCHEGMGGGGGGGTVLIKNSSYIDNTQIEIKGGDGADMNASGFFKVGPGGGGGGGLLWIANSSLPSNINVISTGGKNGVCTGYSNNPWGATAGSGGSNLFNLQIPIDNSPFRPNIDSVKIKDSLLTCDIFNFNGLAYTNADPITTWQWYFGDGGTANTQNTTHTYATGTYTVKLVVTDINGCKDSITKDITATFLAMDAGPTDTICLPSLTVLQATSTGATQYSWTPSTYLNDPAILNPTATPPVTTMFYLTASNSNGCSIKDSVLINVRAANAFSINPPVSICTDKSVQLTASGGDIYSWQPAASLDNSNIFNPSASPGTTTTYSVLITDTLCGNSATLNTIVTVLPLPTVKANSSNDLDCSITQSQLTASGASQYIWTPASTLNSPNTSSPIAMPITTTQYIVTGTDAAGCINYDTVTVNVSGDNKGGYLMPTAFTPNNDGRNDCYGIKYWGTILELEFSIYNRWGERIFFTRNPNECWDGRYKGVPQDPAVFVYMIKAKTTCTNEIFRKGTFALIR